MSKKQDLTTAAGIEAAITSIATAGTKLDNQIQTVGVATLVHFKQHGDVRLVNRLYLALGKGARHAALSSWLLAYGAVVASTDKATKAEKPFICAKGADGKWLKVTNPEAAALDPWHSHKPSKSPDMVLDLQGAIRAILKKAKTATSIEHGDLNMLKAVAVAAGIPESDVPTKLAEKPKAGENSGKADPLASKDAATF
jgi:hypothetical protein